MNLPAPLVFEVEEGLDPQTERPVQMGHFSRNWAEEEEMDALSQDMESGRVSDKQALLRAQKLASRNPRNLEIQNFLACRFWQLEMRDEATQIWQQAYQQALALVPKGYKGQISWFEVDNRSFLRVAHGYLLGLMHQRDGKAAKSLAKKMLAWCPSDNLGVRYLMGDISLLSGDHKTALKLFLKEAHGSPAQWYQAALIVFRQEDYVSACTYLRRGIAANPYIAEGLTGRTILQEHHYWHSSNRYGPDWAVDYLQAAGQAWSDDEIAFVDWVFNSSIVLRERSELMELQEGLTCEQDPQNRGQYAFRSTYFLDTITDEKSKAMVRKYKNRFGVDVWPWMRHGRYAQSGGKPIR